jgi:hypothetical protein
MSAKLAKFAETLPFNPSLGYLKYGIIGYALIAWTLWVWRKIPSFPFSWVVKALVIYNVVFPATLTLGNSGLWTGLLLLIVTAYWHHRNQAEAVRHWIAKLTGKSFEFAKKGVSLSARGLSGALDGLSILKSHPHAKVYKKRFVAVYQAYGEDPKLMRNEEFHVNGFLAALKQQKDKFVENHPDDREVIETIYNACFELFDTSLRHMTANGETLKEELLSMR